MVVSTIQTVPHTNAFETATVRGASQTLSWLGHWFDGIRRYFLREQTRNALMELSDRELDDVGLCRGDIPSVLKSI